MFDKITRPRAVAQTTARMETPSPDADFEKSSHTQRPSLFRSSTCACGGSCPVCRAKSGGLKISQPNDPSEIQADQIAGRILRMPSRKDASASDLPSMSLAHTLHRKALPSTGAIPSQSPRHVQNAMGSGGHPLDAQTRSFFESRMDYDLSGVRVYTDSAAGQSAHAVSARAYSLGSNIVFGKGEYRPETDSGRRLIAHELAHTIRQNGQINRQVDMDAGAPDPRDADVPIAGVPQQPSTESRTTPEPAPPRPQSICGPDITSTLSALYSSIEAYFRPLSSFQKRRSCMALDVDSPFAWVNPIMAWDTRELFLPDTGFLDSYFTSSSCGSPRDAGCSTDPTRHLCETAGTCGNSVVVGGKCMLAGTANYGTYGKMFKLCHDEFSPDFPRWDMRAMINLFKALSLDDPEPPREMATAVFDGAFPTLPAATENRGYCTGRCGRTHSGSFDFVWEPYRPR